MANSWLATASPSELGRPVYRLALLYENTSTVYPPWRAIHARFRQRWLILFSRPAAGRRDDRLEFMKHIVDVAKAQTLQMLDAPMSDKQKCPLCGQPNRCAMSEEHPIGACWCVSIRLTADMLEAVPTEERGVRCICDTCACALASGVA